MKSTGLASILGAVLFTNAASFDAQSDATLQIYVRNFGRVPDDIMSVAKEELHKVFREIHIEIMWTDIPVDIVNGAVGQFNVQVLARSTFKDPSRRAALGSVQRTNRGTQSVHVFYDRIQEFQQASRGSTDRKTVTGRILAYAIAHELGHVLLKSMTHSSKGIMRAKWESSDIEDSAGTMFFASSEGDVIRKQLRKRTP